MKHCNIDLKRNKTTSVIHSNTISVLTPTLCVKTILNDNMASDIVVFITSSNNYELISLLTRMNIMSARHIHQVNKHKKETSNTPSNNVSMSFQSTCKWSDIVFLSCALRF